jgi:hypothetical protein
MECEFELTSGPRIGGKVRGDEIVIDEIAVRASSTVRVGGDDETSVAQTLLAGHPEQRE